MSYDAESGAALGKQINLSAITAWGQGQRRSGTAVVTLTTLGTIDTGSPDGERHHRLRRRPYALASSLSVPRLSNRLHGGGPVVDEGGGQDLGIGPHLQGRCRMWYSSPCRSERPTASAATATSGCCAPRQRAASISETRAAPGGPVVSGSARPGTGRSSSPYASQRGGPGRRTVTRIVATSDLHGFPPDPLDIPRRTCSSSQVTSARPPHRQSASATASTTTARRTRPSGSTASSGAGSTASTSAWTASSASGATTTSSVSPTASASSRRTSTWPSSTTRR